MKSYLRFLSRNKLYTAIEIVGLSLALAFVIILSSYVLDDLSCNKALKNTDDIYLCHREGSPGCFHEVPAIYEQLPEIEGTCNFVQSGNGKSIFNEVTAVSYGELHTSASIMAASETFFDFFTFRLTEGKAEDVLKSKHSVVISEELANTLFPDGDAIGKEINIFEKNPMAAYSSRQMEDFDLNLVITGIFGKFPKTVFKKPDLIMGLDLFLEKQEAMFGGAMRVGEYSFIKINDTVDPSDLAANLTEEFLKIADQYDPKTFKLNIELTQFDDIKKQEYSSFSVSFDNIRKGKLFNIYLIMCIFITIIGLLDYIVLTIAFSRFRIKEMATRQLLGTDRKGIAGRCFIEAFLLLVTSCTFAALISIAFKNPIGQILGTEIHPLGSIDEYLVLAGIIFVMVAAASAVPSILLSSYSAINVIKGEARYRDKVTFGKIFIGFAGFLCITALSLCFGISRQTRHIINQPLGYQTDSIIYVRFNGAEPKRFYDELKAQSYVDHIGSCMGIPTAWSFTSVHDKSGKYENVSFIDGNKEFFEILGIDILEDFNIASSDPYEGKWYMCRSSYENASEYMEGNNIRLYHPAPLSGIVSDFKIGKIKEESSGKFTLINVFDIPEITEVGFPIVKVNIRTDEAIKKIEEFYRQKGHDETILSVHALQEEVDNAVQEENNMLKLLSGFTLVCLLMTIMTVVGLSSYYGKTNEKGNAIRNVFGCSKKDLIRKITIDFVLPVAVSAIVAIPIAYTVIGRWLEGYVIRTDNSPVIYAGAFAIVLIVVLSAILLQAIRMMRTNPAEALKKE